MASIGRGRNLFDGPLVQSDRVELLSTIATEKRGIEPCALIARQKELTIERNCAVLRVERGIDIAGTGDKAVQFERKKGPGSLRPALFTGPTHIYEHVAKLLRGSGPGRHHFPPTAE